MHKNTAEVKKDTLPLICYLTTDGNEHVPVV